jgi:DNA invertase Pin-like site-specific DNA recombinase
MLQKAGCETIRSEKVSGTSMKGKSELETLLEFLLEGDALVVTRLDRLARSLLDLSVIVDQLQAKGVDLIATEQPVDTSTPAGRAFLQMLGVFSEFETSLRKERQMEGIAKALEDGRYHGRKSSIPVDQVKQMRAEGLSPTVIAKQLGIARSSVYRLL